jgi:KAP-like P-loop domain-containing protein
VVVTTRTAANRAANGTGYRILLDTPSDRPALGFPGIADALAEIVMESSPRFAIGLFGGWGSGKTTLMQAIESRLDPSRAIAVRFSAWRYEKEEHLIVPLLDSIRDALLLWGANRRGHQQAAKKTAKTIGMVMRSIVAGSSVRLGVPGAIDLSFDANKALAAADQRAAAAAEARVPRSSYHASFRALKESFEEFAGPRADRRIVVFVDDLDRCLPDNALQVLESMKLFFDLDGFVFVVGLDRDVVEDVIDTKFSRPTQTDGDAQVGAIRGAEYIKKIFQVPFPLTPVVLDQLPEFLDRAFEEANLPTTQRTELEQVVTPHLRYVVGDDNVNPREIKRYINAYTLLTRIHPHLDPTVLLALQTIDFRRDWAQVDDALLAYQSAFVDALQRRANEPTATEDLDPELVSLPDDFLEYVSPGEPGADLLTVPNIEQYLFNAEASRTTHDPSLLRAIRDLGQVGRMLRDAKRNRPSNATFLRDIHKLCSQVRTAIPPPTTSTLAGLAHQDINELISLLEPEAKAGPAKSDWERLDPLVGQLEQLARRAAKRLLRLNRAGNILSGGGNYSDSAVVA